VARLPRVARFRRLRRLTASTTYSYAVCTLDSIGNTGEPATLVTTTGDLGAPGNVSDLNLTGATQTSIGLSWTNPAGVTFSGEMIRRAQGTTPPASPTAGSLVEDTSGPTAACRPGRPTATRYSRTTRPATTR
jgi:hypothetical protein